MPTQVRYTSDEWKGQRTVPMDPEKLKAARESLYTRRNDVGMNYSQYSLARDSGVSRSFISEIELGRKQPRTLAAKAIAEALRVEVDDLI